MNINDDGALNYFSKDFDWDELKNQVENDPSLQFHFLSSYPSQNPTLQNQDSSAWETFHSRHFTGKFFKERRYLLKEFPELASCKNDSKVLEVGCGNGSTIVPILRGHEGITIYACDCSNEALERAKEIINASHSISSKNQIHLFQCEFSTFGFPQWLACKSCLQSFLRTNDTVFSAFPDANCSNMETDSNFSNRCCIGGVDFITMIFTLSAIPFDEMLNAVKHCFSILKPGGLIFFRDYGLYDMTMLRFKPKQKIGYREYLRSDGTRSYFFCLDTVRSLASAAGLNEMELEYCCVKSVNRKNGKVMKRVWVHGKFQKPEILTV